MADHQDWTEDEHRACVRAYLRLLQAQQDGEKLSKAEVRRDILENHLQNRSEGSYEFRMQNISTVMDTMGFPWVTGYLPAKNVGRRGEELIGRLLVEEGLLEVAHAVPSESHQKVKAASEVLRAVAGEKLLSSPPGGNKSPSVVASSVAVVQRDATVRAWVLENADGVCEGCENPAPFVTAGGRPYLEVHHMVRLKDGGPDVIENTVAVCPTCHMRLHHGQDREEYAKGIAERVSRITSAKDAAQ